MTKEPKKKKPFYKRWWFWLIVIVVVIGIANMDGDDEVTDSANDESSTNEVADDSDGDETNNDESTDDESEDASAEESNDEEESEDDVPREYKAALSKAETYSDTMSMSKEGIFDQLVSEHGENFPEDAAQYAIDNIDA